MKRPGIHVAFVAVLALGGGCASPPKPYASDPLLHHAKIRRVKFDSVKVVPPAANVEPVPPEHPPSRLDLVTTDW